MTAATVLVLFDIDGTLIRTGGAGVRGMNAAFASLHGCARALDGVPVAGRTDRAILAEVFGRLNVEMSEADLVPVRDAYLESLAQELAGSSGPGVGVLPGVDDVLLALEANAMFMVGLLTGNFVRGAEIKLSWFDLWRRFRIGAFGDHHVNRRELVPVALERAREIGVSPSHVIVVGDTPLDIDCAHANGARAVGVATGAYTARDLASAGADLVVGTLAELEPAAERLARLCASSG